MSHKEPVLCCGYSEEFRQVVSCSEGSVSGFEKNTEEADALFFIFIG